jgi:hypothetical protein
MLLGYLGCGHCWVYPPELDGEWIKKFRHAVKKVRTTPGAEPLPLAEAIHASNMHKERTARRISFQISTLRTTKKEQHTGRSGRKTKLQKYPPKHTHTHTHTQAV